MPVALDVNTAPLFSVMLAAEPGVDVIKIASLPALIEPRASDWSVLKVNDPSVPLVEIVLTMLLPVRLTVPGPLAASVLAVITPAPDNVAPEATTTLAVPEPRFHDPDRIIVPAFTAVPPE